MSKEKEESITHLLDW